MQLWLSLLLYLAVAVFLIGLGWRLLNWLRTPVPLKIPLTPGPADRRGVLWRLGGELFAFRALWRANRSLWTPAWIFHVALVLLLIGHFGGLETPRFACATLGGMQAAFCRVACDVGLPFAGGLTGMSMAQFGHFEDISGGLVGAVALAALLWLLLRRLLAERVRSISTFSDYFALLLLLLIIVTGNDMRFMGGLNIEQARQFVAGWLTLHPTPAPADPVFAMHILLVCALLIYIPFSKLVHIGGAALFSPTLNQRNNPRQRRYAGPWDKTNASATA